MKKLIWKIVIPMTLILFSTITMWRYVLIVDGGDEVLTGFPLPYICPGWHTSLSYQIFISGFLIDIVFYFFFCLFVVFVVNRFIWEIKTGRRIVIALYIISGLLILDPIFLLGLNNHVYKFKNDFDTKTLESGVKFWHFGVERPDLNKYALIQQDYIEQLDYSWDALNDKNNSTIKYVKQAQNPYLGFSPTKRIDEVNFIDSIIVLSQTESKILLQIITDSLNFEENNFGQDRYFVHSGFIISTNDTLHGAVHMTFDLDCIDFTPDLNSASSWTLTEKGKLTMKNLINKIEKQRTPNTQYKKLPTK